jgi:hypothetical protein
MALLVLLGEECLNDRGTLRDKGLELHHGRIKRLVAAFFPDIWPDQFGQCS